MHFFLFCETPLNYKSVVMAYRDKMKFFKYVPILMHSTIHVRLLHFLQLPQGFECQENGWCTGRYRNLIFPHTYRKQMNLLTNKYMKAFPVRHSRISHTIFHHKQNLTHDLSLTSRLYYQLSVLQRFSTLGPLI